MFAYNAKARSDARSQMSLDDKFIILQPARLVYQKNPSFTLKVFAEVYNLLPNAILLFAGDGDSRGALETEAVNLGISDRVYFFGFRRDIPMLLNMADLMVMPSLFEGLAITAIEAQCSGISCLLSENMTEETVVSDDAMRLRLDVGLWRDTIAGIARNGYERRDRSSEVAAAGYSLKEQIKILERIYAGEEK